MQFHQELSDKLWENNELKPEVADKLNEIADAFIEFLEVDRNAIKDVVITGSMASYNYTQYSDVDLHLKVDYDKIHEDCPIVQGYLWQSKAMFNKNHDISIYGVPVEVYAESIDEDTVHNGLYSLWQGKWIDFPEKIKPTDNDSAVEAKFNEFKDMAANINDSEEAERLINKLYEMRKAGLEEVGEFSTENLAFKKVRDAGILDKLKQMKKERIDKQLSLESYNESIQDKLKEVWDLLIEGTNQICLEDSDTVKEIMKKFDKLKTIKSDKLKLKKAKDLLLDISGYMIDEKFDNYQKKIDKFINNSKNESLKEAVKPNIDDYNFIDYRNPDAYIGTQMPERGTYRKALKSVANEIEQKSQVVRKTYWGATPAAKQFRIELDNIWRHNSVRDILSVAANSDLKKQPELLQAVNDVRQYGEDLLKELEPLTQWNGKEWVKPISESLNESISSDVRDIFKKYPYFTTGQAVKIGEELDKLPKGITITYKADNCWHDCEITIIKTEVNKTFDDVKTNWTYIYSVDGKEVRRKGLTSKDVATVIREDDAVDKFIVKESVNESMKDVANIYGIEFSEFNKNHRWNSYDEIPHKWEEFITASNTTFQDAKELIKEKLGWFIEQTDEIQSAYITFKVCKGKTCTKFIDITRSDLVELNYMEAANKIVKEVYDRYPQLLSENFEESYEENIYNPALIQQAYNIEQNWYKELGLGEDEQADEVMLFIINDGKIEDTKKIKRKDVYTYTGDGYALVRSRDTGWVLEDYYLQNAKDFVESWNESKNWNELIGIKEDLTKLINEALGE